MKRSIPEVADSFSRTHTFSTESIAEFARLIWDANPLHHDLEAASASRFGGLIASGGHTVSVAMGAVASWMSERCENVGLGYSARLRRPVPAGMTCRIDWRVVALEHSAKLGGTIASMEGAVVRDDGQTAVSVTAQALIFA